MNTNVKGAVAERDVVVVHLFNSRCTPNGYVRNTCTEDEVDLVAVYCGELDRSFLLPASRCARLQQIHLRLRPARNGQLACINLAEDFEFDGAIAQLGERGTGSAEVAGSSPASSTLAVRGAPVDRTPVTVGSNAFRDRLGYWMVRVAAGQEVVVTFRGRPRVRLNPAVAHPAAAHPPVAHAAGAPRAAA
jgi:antitoxin (DNA-binding transcriptional repressor) of toxin-antitoxin stability system